MYTQLFIWGHILLFSIFVTDAANPVVNTFVLFPCLLLFFRLIERGKFMESKHVNFI